LGVVDHHRDRHVGLLSVGVSARFYDVPARARAVSADLSQPRKGFVHRLVHVQSLALGAGRRERIPAERRLGGGKSLLRILATGTGTSAPAAALIAADAEKRRTEVACSAFACCEAGRHLHV
jgi:hypothetical protein